MPRLTTIICTHNPRREFLEQAVAHLREQTLPTSTWEFLVVDNGSDIPVASWLDVTWHPHARVIREEKIGLTNARLCGIRHTQAPTLVFVDDDNLLAPNYLEEALAIQKSHPFLGAWGGQQNPVFLAPPPEWLREDCKDLLACRPVQKPCWTNMPGINDATPVGAGMCVLKTVADRYAETLSQDDLRKSLGRTGGLLLACDDHDLALTSCDMGLGVGVFPSLTLDHLIPKNRLEEDYLWRIAEGVGYSSAVLHYCRTRTMPVDAAPTMLRKAWFRFRLLSLPLHRRKRALATARGWRKGLAFLREHEKSLASAQGVAFSGKQK